MIKTRIAPSPTGTLHIGTARSALFNYLFAKQRRGVFVVRIEDTDRARSKKEYEDNILEGLRWLGLEWDEFYRQSERMGIYKKYIEKLLEEGRAFYCYHSQEETKGKAHFCEYRDKEYQGVSSKYQGVIRFKVPLEREIEFEDIVRGKVKFNTNEIGDFSIAKSADEPLYNLAVVIDDYEMAIMHIIRGEDHISNTPKQILLQQALGFSTPLYAHLPLVLGPDKKKFSKRHGATSVDEFRAQGYLPEALVNMLAFLGWNPGDEREFFSLEDLAKEFSLERIKKGAAIFNIERLNFINQYYIKTLPLEYIAQKVKDAFLYTYGEKAVQNTQKLQEIVALGRDRSKTLKELAESMDFVFILPSYPSELLSWKGESSERIKKNLLISVHLIEKIPLERYNKDELQELFFSSVEKEERGLLLWPLRVALCGKKISPGPFEIASVLGKDETLKRIHYAIEKIS